MTDLLCCSRRPSINPRRTPVTSRVIRRESARMAANILTLPSGQFKHLPNLATATRQRICFRSSIQSTTLALGLPRNATRWSHMWCVRMSIPFRHTWGGAAGHGTPARPGGCRSEEHTSELPSPFKFLFRLFFFNDTATTEIYTLSLHDALPICVCGCLFRSATRGAGRLDMVHRLGRLDVSGRFRVGSGVYSGGDHIGGRSPGAP